MTFLLWALPCLPALAGAVLVAGGIMRRLDRFAGVIGCGVAAVTLGVAIVVAVGRPHADAPFLDGLRAGLGVDGLSAVMVITVAAVTLLVLAYGATELSGGRFFGLMLLFSAAMQLTVTATTLPLLLVGWEVMGATSYALIGYWWRDPRRVGSATTAFVTTRAADLGLYIAAGAALAGVHDQIALLPAASPGWRDVIAAGIVVAAAGKSAQLPFSFWLSRAMDGPSPVSALLHSATMVAAGAYLLLRTAPLLQATGWAAPAVAWLGAATAVALGVVALAQPDLKQLLAASTCAQVGFMVLAAGSGAVAGGAAQLVGHAATKALLFCLAGVWLTALGTKRLAALRGAARRWRPVGVLFTVGTLGLAGVPPLALWATKDAALSGAAHDDVPLYAVGVLGAALSAAYSARALALVWAPAEPVYDDEQRGTRRVTPAMVAPLAVLAAFAVGLVVLGLPPLAARLRDAIGAGPASTVTELAVSAVVAAVVMACVAWLVRAEVRVPVPHLAVQWWYLEAAAHRVVVAPTMALARGAAWADERLDAALTRLAGGTLLLARASQRVAEVRVDDVVAGIARAGRRLGDAARRPQTGQLHQYYAQAAAGLAVVVLVLLIVR